MAEWQTTEPPLGTEIQYQRDSGQVEQGTLDTAGKFGMGPAGKAPNMRQQYRRQGMTEMFEVTRWRPIDD
ncbi:hypothetical protein MOV76_15435 [Rhizobium sp. PRIMUS64]|uniref:hypothetical protein n=1 Tax=Rhizobium sp. PRIMUS64 TaxID=2908925 RepID=UPI001FF37802|nr:hypothetical protein [Rhizobium sp. PRIMUS64]MCJ9692999.1 hypothetical protein [Rhizobium sp. PRIMUS64]